LERDGEVYCRAAYQRFYLAPPELREHNNTPSSFVMLGLSYPATREQVTKAFRRKSKEAHPDKGGTDAAFIELQDAYKRALVMTYQ
jgi:DnaJ-class molecular chaperone